MVEIVLKRLNGTDDEVLIFPLEFLLNIVLPVVIGVVVVVVCCFLTSCVVCFCCGRRSARRKEEKLRRKHRSERDGTIYSEVNPSGMIENQNITLRSNKQRSIVLTSFVNKHTTPPTPPPIKLTPIQTTTTPSTTHKFQKSVSMESTYQEMIPTNLMDLNREMESIEEMCEKGDRKIGVFVIPDRDM